MANILIISSEMSNTARPAVSRQQYSPSAEILFAEADDTAVILDKICALNIFFVSVLLFRTEVHY